MTLEFTFKSGWFSEADEWAVDQPAISDSAALTLIRKALESRILMVEHRFYRGSSAPNRVVFDDYDTFEEYLKKHGKAGDSIWVFDVTDALEDGKQLVHGKCPNERGESPKKGAY